MKGRLTAALTLAALLALPASAQSQTAPYPPGPFAPWNGSNPFNCELQDVGLGVAFPDPGADPFCVKFDKTQQNLTELGILDFLANEPARVAAAVPKCFYYQRDHWTASVVQGQPPEIWNWVGSYFFDKARAVGGVNVEDFRILGQPASPSAYGQVPAELEPYFDQAGGGAYVVGDVPADPACAARVDTPAEAAQVYGAAWPPPRPGTGASGSMGPARPAGVKRCKRSGGVEATASKKKGKRKKKRRCGRRGKKRGKRKGKRSR